MPWRWSFGIIGPFLLVLFVNLLVPGTAWLFQSWAGQERHLLHRPRHRWTS